MFYLYSLCLTSLLFLLNTLQSGFCPHSRYQSSVLSPWPMLTCSSRDGGHDPGAYGLVCMTTQSLTFLQSLLKYHLLIQVFSDLLLKTQTHSYPQQTLSPCIYITTSSQHLFYIVHLLPLNWKPHEGRDFCLCVYCCIPRSQHSTWYATSTLYKLAE